jgi:poly-gamma-glutamate synthesis protein (capsule biosynthesis protein)
MSSATIFGVGDVGPLHEPISRYSALVRPVLARGDIRFAQCERLYSERGALQLHSGGAHSRLAPGMASVFSDCGFDVVSLASNHAMDWGPDALLDTIEVFRERGIRAVGAGRDLAEARAPAIVEANGVRVAFLAYCSILHEGYEATAVKPGVAPPEVVTVPYEEDLAALLDDVRAAKSRADVVVLSLHWGIHYIPRLIAGYQPQVARAAFEAGADVIFGHHAHTPKAIGVHGGKVCFYSLSNFIMSSTAKSPEKARAFEAQYSVTLDPAYPHLAYGADAKRSLIAKATASRAGLERVAFLPVLIDRQLRPAPLRHGEPAFDDAVRFMMWASEGFGAELRPDGDEVAVTPKTRSGSV